MPEAFSRYRTTICSPDLLAIEPAGSQPVDISIVMPCLNEERSVGLCVSKAWEGIRKTGLRGEVIVADNGSRDNSVAVAEEAGARVVHQPLRGYGHAYQRGFSAALGSVIVMGDSDNTYDFTTLPELIEPLYRGADCVLGSRFAGNICAGAMPWSHRYIGNPVLTALLNFLFKLRVSDAHTGFRAFTRQALDRMAPQCGGMEFASEMLVRAAEADLRVAEAPITYYRRIGESKLQSFPDAWRHVRFLLLLSPDYLFVNPGLAAVALGLAGQLVLLGLAAGPAALAIKILLALVTLAGSQLLMFGLLGRRYAGPARRAGAAGRARTLSLEHGLACAATLVTAGLALVVRQFMVGWGPVARGGGAASAAIVGLLAVVLGGELAFNALLLAMFALRHDPGEGGAGNGGAMPGAAAEAPVPVPGPALVLVPAPAPAPDGAPAAAGTGLLT